MKKKIKVWNKINLCETSVVGIPAYPDAHFSLIKALHSLDERRDTYMVGETEVAPLTAETPVTETKAEEKTEKTEAKVEVAKAESKEKVETKSEKTEEVDNTALLEMIEKAVERAIEKASVKRGLVAKQDYTNIKKSVGELAIEAGLFGKK